MPPQTKSVSISLDEALRLRNMIAHRGLRVSPPRGDSELFVVKEDPIELTVYKNGTLVYRDNRETAQILAGVLTSEGGGGYDFLVGSDETGKGEWFGPLVVVAAAAPPETVDQLRRIGVRDSKEVPKGSLDDLVRAVRTVRQLTWKEVILTPSKYNELYSKFKAEGKTLNDLLAWAHAAALRRVLGTLGENRVRIVIDKFDAAKMDLRLRSVDRDRVTVIQRTKGEEDPMVATASILAKWLFEQEVDKLSGRFLIDLRRSSPQEVPKERLPEVAKLHFQNVSMVKAESRP